MSGLNKPTIEGLIEKLLSDNYIKPDEEETVQSMLQSATSGMTTEEISILIGSLNDKVEAPSSELLTQDGINLSVLESAINETTKVIIREKNIREQSQAKVEDPLEKILQKEQEEREHQEQIEKTKEFLANLSQEFSEVEFNFKLTDEESIEYASIINSPHFKNMIKLMSECIANGKDPEEAFNKYAEENGISWSFDKVTAAAGFSVFQKGAEIRKKGKKGNAAVEELAENEADLVTVVCGSVDEFRKKGFSFVGTVLNNVIQRTREKDMKYQTTVLKEAALGGKYLTYDELKRKVVYLEQVKIDYYDRIKKTLHKNNDQVLTEEDSKKRNELFHEITNEYLATGRNFSTLYKITKDNPLIQDMSFEEFFDRIIEDLKSNSKGSKEENSAITGIIEIEREDRINYKLAEQLGAARNNLQLETGDIKKRIEEYDINYESDCKNFINENKYRRVQNKSILCQKRGLDQKNYESQFKLEKKSVDECEQAISEFNCVIRDRQEIIKLAKECNISKEEAAQKYFAENTEARNHYNKKEQKFLFDEKNKTIRNKFITRLKTVIINRKEKAIEKTKEALKNVREDIELESGNIYNSIGLADALKKESDLKRKLKKLENKQKRRKRLRDGKNAFDIVDDKNKKIFEKNILKMFEDGKSAAEILKTLEENGNEYDFSFEEVLNTIVSGNKKNLTIKDIKILTKNEKEIYDASIKKYAAEKKLQNVKAWLEEKVIEKNEDKTKNSLESYLKDWEQYHSFKIDKFNEDLEKKKPETQKIREKIKKRKEFFFRIRNISKKEKNENESQKTPVQKQQPDNSKSSEIIEEPTEQQIEAEEMTVPPKLQFDFKAIASRGNVTHSSMKESAEEMISLKSKEDKEQDSIKHKDGQHAADEDIRQ